MIYQPKLLDFELSTAVDLDELDRRYQAQEFVGLASDDGKYQEVPADATEIIGLLKQAGWKEAELRN